MPRKQNLSSGAVVLVADRSTGSGLARRHGRSAQVHLTPSDLAELDQKNSTSARRQLRGRDEDGSTLYRCRRQLRPLWTATMVYATGALGAQLIDWWPQMTGLAYGTAAAAGVIALAIIAYTVESRWRVRAILAAITGTLWLLLALQAGITWTTSGILLGVTSLLAARWWQHHRPGYPTAPPEKPTPQTDGTAVPDRKDISGMFAHYIAGKGGILPGAYLTNREQGDHALKWTIELVPGQQSIATVRTQMENFLSGLRRPQESVIVEPHPSRDPAQLLLSVVTTSPITDTVPFDGPKYFREGKDGWIEPATYADGAGRVQVPVYAPNSARHLTIIGGQGSGKSAMLNAMTVSLMASGHTTVWYLDGQDGGSSPQLMRYADWAPTGDDREKVMLEALERLFVKRARRMKRERRSGLTPSQQFPGLIVIFDECHETWQPNSAYLARWIKLTRKARKLCVGFWAATQHPSIESFGGSDTLRSLLMQYTTLVLRTKGNVSKNILSMAQDPATLPTLPGYGYVLSGDGATREAPFRADFLDDDDPEDGTAVPADLWFEQYPCPPLHPSEQAAIGVAYRDRVAIAEAKWRELEHEDDDPELPFSPSDEDDHADTMTGSPLGPPRFPRFTVVPAQRDPEPDNHDEPPTGDDASGVPDGVTGQAAAVYQAIAAGANSRTELETATGLGKTRLYELLNTLRDTGHITKQGRGRWALTTEPEAHQPADDAELPDPSLASDDLDDLGDVDGVSSSDMNRRVLDSIRRRGVTTAEQIQADTGLEEDTITQALDALRADGHLIRGSGGTYAATSVNPT